ncbi:MAG: hypothetical protein K6F15_06275 [Treponema sp.]|nr:hypothetical protein [Treponema sp.]
MTFKLIKDTLKDFDCWKGEGNGIEPDVICSDEELEQKLKKLQKIKVCG